MNGKVNVGGIYTQNTETNEMSLSILSTVLTILFLPLAVFYIDYL